MSGRPSLRIAMAIDMEWPLKRHHDAVAGILRYAKEQTNWQCILDPWIGSCPNAQDPAEQYDGVVGRIDEKMGRHAFENQLPTVNIWINSPDPLTPRVLPDLHAASMMAAKHLMERGFQRFAFIGLKHSPSSQTRYEGLLNMVGQNPAQVPQVGIAPTAQDAQSWQTMQVELKQFLANLKPPVGVVAADDLFARYFVDVCLNAGLRVPDDVSVVGMGNEPLICDALEPALTSIDSGYDRIGHQAAALLHRLIEGHPTPNEPILVDPTELIARRSTDVFAVDDRSVANALRFIWDHRSKRIGVDDIVEGMPMTRRTLERRFRDVLGRSIHDEIMRSKIEHAKKLLVETRDAIQVVAHNCGFSSQAHMSKVFKRFENSAPSEFRKRRSRSPMASTR